MSLEEFPMDLISICNIEVGLDRGDGFGTLLPGRGGFVLDVHGGRGALRGVSGGEGKEQTDSRRVRLSHWKFIFTPGENSYSWSRQVSPPPEQPPGTYPRGRPPRISRACSHISRAITSSGWALEGRCHAAERSENAAKGIRGFQFTRVPC